MYNDDNQADMRDTLRLSDLLRSMAEQSIHKQLPDGPMSEASNTSLLAYRRIPKYATHRRETVVLPDDLGSSSSNRSRRGDLYFNRQ
jgi:hypothetical protein